MNFENINTYLGLPLSLYIYFVENFLLQPQLKNSVKSPNLLASHMKKSISKVTSICKPNLNSAELPVPESPSLTESEIALLSASLPQFAA